MARCWSTPARSPRSPPATSLRRCRSPCVRRSPAGWAGDDTRPLVFVLDEDQDRGELARQCRTIGYDHLKGELAGGMAAWRAAGLPQAQLPLVEAEQLGDQPALVLDVRQASEVADGHLPGAVTVELGALAGDRLSAQLPEGPVT